MNLRTTIVLMSGLAVISDTVLIAFYPQFFAERYGVHSSLHTGAYIAAISIAVMSTLPLWARVARRVETMPLLMATQLAAGLLCLLSARADTVQGYWVLSLAMFMCKSSYLLMYPYLMRRLDSADHATTVGMLSVVVHVGGIAGAVAGGALLRAFGADSCLWLMAMGDFAQMALCAWLIRSGRAAPLPPSAAHDHAPGSSPIGGLSRAVIMLGVVMLVFDFSAYLVRPFFSLYWESLSGIGHRAVTGLVFAIPGVVALLALALNHRLAQRGGRLPDHLLVNLGIGATGLALQAAPDPAVLVVGRVLYGWALFQVVVKLEVSLFRLSTPQRYAQDYSITNACQNLGVLLSSFAAGALMDRLGQQVAFGVAAAGWVVTACLGRRLLRAPVARPVDADGQDETSLLKEAGHVV